MLRTIVPALIALLLLSGCGGGPSRTQELETIQALKEHDRQLYIQQLSQFIIQLDKQDPLFNEAVAYLVDALIADAGAFERQGKYHEAIKIYRQAYRMNKDNKRVVALYKRAKNYRDLTQEEFATILLGMNKKDLKQIAGHPIKKVKKTDETGQEIVEYHFITMANKWETAVVVCDAQGNVVDKRFPEKPAEPAQAPDSIK